jgi:lysophospholipase L1-like esterase
VKVSLYLFFFLFFNPLVFANKIVLIGDSTVAHYENRSQQGWGSYLRKRLVSGASVKNLARGGRSTKTFISEGHFKKALNEKGKYVFIQFGHNDQSKKHTSANSSYKSNLTKMIKDVLRNNGIPVIVSSPTRKSMKDELKPYVDAARSVASKEGVPFIDLYKASRDTYKKRGTSQYFVDGTHTNSKGADLLASLVANEMKKNSRLKRLVK